MQIAVTAGAVAGFALFLVQSMFVTPLIRQAEVYEHQAEASASEAHGHAEAEADGTIERVVYTGMGTILTGIGFGAVFLGLMSLLGQRLDIRRGAWLGVAAFLCVTVAPSLGLPPRPPGAAAPDVHAAQLWWVLTVASTGAGLWLLATRSRSSVMKGLGALAIALPHLIGSPRIGAASVVPSDLAFRFAVTSIGSQAVFWLMLGSLGGWLQASTHSDSAQDVSLVPR